MDAIRIPTPTAPEQSHRILRRLIPSRFHPFVRGLRKRIERSRLHLPEPFHTVYPYTQVSMDRQRNLHRLAELVVSEGVPGDIVECGVLDGGTAALMAHGSGCSRPVHLFDAWLGLPPTTAADGQESEKWSGDVVGSPRRVLEVMRDLDVPTHRLHVHRGWFHETFPTVDIPQIALLHVDCDFYEPTKLCLERWWPSIVAGGFVQFDDYSDFRGCHQAVNEWLARNQGVEFQRYGAGGGAAYYVRKG